MPARSMTEQRVFTVEYVSGKNELLIASMDVERGRVKQNLKVHDIKVVGDHV